MKNLFNYEINESIAAKAAMNCVYKRLFKENYRGDYEPQEEVVRGFYDPYEWEYDDYGNAEKRQLIHQALVQAGLIQSEKEGWQLNNKIQELLDKTDFSVSNEQDAMKFVKTYGQQIVGETQEQEEHPEDADRLQSQLANAWDEGMEDDYVPYKNTFDETHNDIVDNLISAVEHYFDTDDDVSGFNHYDYTEDQIGKAVEKVLDKYGDFPSSNNFNKCYAWTKKHAEELMKILETGSLENTYEGHPEFDFSEQEEMPEMEQNDIKQALTQYLSEVWIDTTEDGDLDELYYAVSDYLDSTGDYPASADWEDCEPWCEEHYQDIENLFLGGSF